MPPRKRTTRINTRAKPKAPVGDEGKSLTEQERQMKLDVFLEDYDAKVAANIKKMEEKIVQLTKLVTSRLKAEIMHLPEQVREMTMKQFIECGGTRESAIEFIHMNTTATLGMTCPVSSKLVRTLSQRPTKRLGDTILEEASASPTPSQTRKRAAASRTTTKKNRLLQESSVYRPQSVLNSALRSSRYQTPSQRAMVMSGLDTPLITPKFNPKLPYTPAGAREPKPGERLMSITGSPVANPADSSIKLTDKGLSLHINNIDDIEDMDIDIPEEQVRKVMAMFKNIMKKAKQ